MMRRKTSFWRYVSAILAGAFIQFILVLVVLALNHYQHPYRSSQLPQSHPSTNLHNFSILSSILAITEALLSGYAAGYVARARGVLIGVLNVVTLPILGLLFAAGIAVVAVIRAMHLPGDPGINGGDAAEVVLFSAAIFVFYLKKHWLGVLFNFLLSLTSSVAGSIAAVRFQQQ